MTTQPDFSKMRAVKVSSVPRQTAEAKAEFMTRWKAEFGIEPDPDMCGWCGEVIPGPDREPLLWFVDVELGNGSMDEQGRTWVDVDLIHVCNERCGNLLAQSKRAVAT